jgi:lipopolysaccharide transport protein LptA
MAFSIRRPAIAAVILGATAFAAIAQERNTLPITVEARSSDFDYKNRVLVFNDVTIVQGAVRITAERAQANGLDFDDSGWEFNGSVRIKLADGALASDTARVRFAKGEIQSATMTGAPATFDQRRDQQLSQGRGNRIDYDLSRGTVELAGDAWLTDGCNEITGPTLVYSTGTQRVISREQVVITIKPRETACTRASTPAPAAAPKTPE